MQLSGAICYPHCHTWEMSANSFTSILAVCVIYMTVCDCLQIPSHLLWLQIKPSVVVAGRHYDVFTSPWLWPWVWRGNSLFAGVSACSYIMNFFNAKVLPVFCVMTNNCFHNSDSCVICLKKPFNNFMLISFKMGYFAFTC